MRRLNFLVAVLSLAWLFGCGSTPGGGEPFLGRIEEYGKEPIPEGWVLKVETILSCPALSAHLTRVRAGASPAPHFHQSHDETVYVLSGSGRMTIGDRAAAIEAGSLVHVPRGTVHSVVADPGSDLAGLAIFTPAFDGEDRHLVKESEP